MRPQLLVLSEQCISGGKLHCAMTAATAQTEPWQHIVTRHFAYECVTKMMTKTREDTQSYLKVCSEVGIPVGLAHQLSHLTTKDVVHHTDTLLKVMQARQQSLDCGLGVAGMQLLHFLIRQFCQRGEQLCQVATHVGVRPIPYCQVWDLGKALQDRDLILTCAQTSHAEVARNCSLADWTWHPST